MNLIQVTADPLQSQIVSLPNGVGMQLQLYYRPIQQGWFINTLVYQNFTLNTLRITNQVNLLRQWKNIIPFGLGCFSTGNREPSLLQDFSSGQSALYILDAAEVAFYESVLVGGS